MNDVNILESRALVVEDFDEAMEALRALKAVDRIRAQHVALSILHGRIEDVFYQAYAFEILYDVSILDAVRYVEENASTADPYILRSMLICVAVDVGSDENRNDVMKAVAALRHALTVRSPSDLQEIQEQKKFFEDAYFSK